MYNLEFTKKAAKFYRKADTVTVRRLNHVFDKLSENPFEYPNIKYLKGELSGSCRIRVGDIRILFSVDEENHTVFIEIIGYRGDVYKI
ncbi:MAG: type II toxin-antitoxin system RelE/ParE family toxin [Desulfococcaceae bacterium]